MKRAEITNYICIPWCQCCDGHIKLSIRHHINTQQPNTMTMTIQLQNNGLHRYSPAALHTLNTSSNTQNPAFGECSSHKQRMLKL